MYHIIKMLKCSRCGSTDIVKEMNQPNQPVKCNQCGHKREEPETSITTLSKTWEWFEFPCEMF